MNAEPDPQPCYYCYQTSFKWQYMAVAGAGAEIIDKGGAGAETMDKGGARAENK